ncbi:MAG: hypothetical protein KatS3mg109_0152 [Pirellulaceae bacterium]|nr:MAG: hypothetical protein KatS3mg109_0152 [Pirellulaceae bacterium]
MVDRPNLSFDDLRQSKDEHTFVRDLVATLKLPEAERRHLRRIAESRGGYLSLAVWEEAFPEFPVLFRMRNVSSKKEHAKLYNFLSKTGASREAKAYEEFLVSEGLPDWPMAVVAKFPNQNDWIVMHNLIRNDNSTPVLVIPSTTNPESVHYYVEPLSTFVRQLPRCNNL